MARLIIALTTVTMAVATQATTSISPRSRGDDVLLSNRGFTSSCGHYGGAAISSRGRLFVVWAEGERDYRTGTVWFNSVPPGH